MIKKPTDFVFAISKGQYKFDQYTEPHYIPYVVNKWISIYNDCILPANIINMYPDASRKMQHDFLFYQIQPKKSRFIKWETSKPQQDKYIKLIIDRYKYSVPKARQIVQLLTEQQLKEIEQQQE